MCVCLGMKTKTEVEGGRRGEYRVGRAFVNFTQGGGHQVSLKAGPRGSQSQSELYLHAVSVMNSQYQSECRL